MTHQQRRKPTRLPKFDYRLPGPYFVTICTHGRASSFGVVVNGEVQLNGAGEMVAEIWEAIPMRFAAVVVDACVVMPDHFHGALWFEVDTPDACVSLGDVAKWFKAVTTNRYIRGVRERGWPPFDGRLWQRNYHEHVIRDDADMERIRAYIASNPANWAVDEHRQS